VTAARLTELFDAAETGCRTGDSVSDFEPPFHSLLTFIREHPSCRDEASARIVASIRTGAFEWELLAYLMHALRWPEVKQAALERIVASDDWRIKTPLSHVVEAFEDDWEGAEVFRDLRRLL
jgi:hypothetical protein